MPMTISNVNYSVSIERRLISNLIMSTDLLQACHDAGSPKLFSPGVCRTVAQWIWDYFDKVGEAPQRAITDLFLRNAERLQPADSEMIEKFLSGISDEWAPTNLDLIKSDALKFFRIQAIVDLKESLERALLTRDPSVGENLVAEYIAPAAKRRDATSMFSKDAAKEIQDAFSQEEESLFSFSGDAGKVIGGFAREDFAAFSAPPKRGKTWWLIRSAKEAAAQGLNVLFISLEMRKEQIIRRFWSALTHTSRYGEEAAWPIFVEDVPGTYTVQYRRVPTTKTETTVESIEKAQAYFRQYFRGRLEIRNYPTMSFSVRQLRSELKDMEVYEGFIPDVIVLDYADIMDHGNANKDERDRLNSTWSSLRGLASERKCVIITGSQTGRATVTGTRDANEADIAEDIRKVAHVTKMIMINQTPQERENGIYRISCNTSRDQAVTADQLVCTACLAIGDPMMDAKLLSKTNLRDAGATESGASDDGEPARRSRKGFSI